MVNDKYDFPTTPEYSREMILKVQKILLDMAKRVAKVLDDNNVKYMLAFGSMLGAVREKGFIPWDDDLDFMILEEDYDKAIKCLDGNLPEWIIIQNRETDSKYAACWTKLRYKNSETYAELFKTDNSFTYRGICLDLYKCECVKRKDVERVVLKENIAWFNRKFELLGLMTKAEFDKKMEELEPLYEKAIEESKSSTQNEEVFAFTTIYKQNYYIRDWVLPLKKYAFEDTEFWGPKNAELILSLTYPNYMEIPPYEKRCPHYAWVKLTDN